MTAPIRRTAAQTAHARQRIEMEEACRLLGGAMSRAFRTSDQDQGRLSGPGPILSVTPLYGMDGVFHAW